MIQSVKLSKLHLSDLNVRKRSDLAIEPLAADIAARGVLQNLLITPATKPRGSFAVFDGGRRLRALHLLVERADIAADDYDVPVKVLKGDDATLSETSLAANFHQLAMTPAEECRAFQHFLGQDGDIDAVANRFGITRRFVEGRLRLANLAEPIFTALAAGEMTLDIAKAYASTDSQERQLLIFNTYGGYGYMNADAVRRAIANEAMKASDPVARLVGEDAYVAAGGKVDRDLFSDDGDHWINPEIAQRLAAEVMEKEARAIGEATGLAWIRPLATSRTYSAASGLHRVPVPQIALSDEQRERLEAIGARLDVIEVEMEDEGLANEAYEAFEVEAQALSSERDALHNRPRALPDDLKPLVGAFLTLSPAGEMLLDHDYYSEAPLPRGEALGEDDQDDADGVRDGSGSAAPGPRPEAVAPGGKPLSARLYDELAMQRRDVLAASLLSHPALALDYALFAMVDAARGHAHYGTTISARGPQDPVYGDVPASRARDHLAEVADALDNSWSGASNEVDRFEAFRTLDDDSKAAWLAYVVATSLEAKSDHSPRQNALQNRLASIMEVDVARWWRPTSENFFDRVPKGALLTLLGEVGGAQLAGRHAAAKKTEISRSCQTLFAGEAIIEAEVRDRALAWVPDAMRFLDTQSPSELAIDDAESGEEAVVDEAADAADAEPDEAIAGADDVRIVKAA